METLSYSLNERLTAFGIHPASAPPPGGSYLSVNVRGSIAYVAIQFPIQGNKYLYQGRFGKDISTTEGYQAARLSAVNILAQMEKYVGLEKVLGLNHAEIYYQCSKKWDEGPIVANGASGLFVQVLEEKGQHSRVIFGVDQLPRNFCLGISCTFTLA